MLRNLDELFEVLQREGIVSRSRLRAALLEQFGIDFDKDERFALAHTSLKFANDDNLTQSEFVRHLSTCSTLLLRIYNKNLAVTDWKALVEQIRQIFEEVKPNAGGKVADYIPELKKADRNQFAISVCTVDGQRMHIGDSSEMFSMQSVSFPILYMISLEENDSEVHEKVGYEPSGKQFNAFTFLPDGKPHNSYVNAGAMICLSFIQHKMDISSKFSFIKDKFSELAGGEQVGYSNSVYLSEKETGWRNKSLSCAMMSAHAFPEWISSREAMMNNLDLYFQMCSIEVNTQSLSVMAATMANHGTCPTTNKHVFAPLHVGASVALMYTCGMYNYSGEFAFLVGLPAKSGVSGGLMVVVPGVMGIAVWSPPLDSIGNSVRGVEVCKLLTSRLNMHGFDRFPRAIATNSSQFTSIKKPVDQQLKMQSAFQAASLNDIPTLRKLFISGISVNCQDEEGNTPMMVACARRQVKVVKYLRNLKADPLISNRMGLTALDFAADYPEIFALLG